MSDHAASTRPPTPPVPSLVYESTQDELRASLRKLLEQQASPHRLLAFVADDSTGYDEPLWTSIAREMGLAGLLIPEEYGGAGGSVRDAAVVMEELGRAVAPVPFLASAVLATSVLTACARAGNEPAAAELRRLSESGIATVAIPATVSPQAEMPLTLLATDGRITGRVQRVLAADCADQFVVAARDGADPALYLVSRSDPGLTVSGIVDLDQTRPLADLSFIGAQGVLLAGGPAVGGMLADVVRLGATMLACELVGGSDWALAETVSYLSIRHQFGRAIGSYQSLRHRAAQLWIDNGQARAVAIYAAACTADAADDLEVASAMAKAYCSSTALTAIEECLQMHGGIGFTWEHPVHLHLKRTFAASVLFGTVEEHELALGSLVHLPAPEGWAPVASLESLTDSQYV